MRSLGLKTFGCRANFVDSDSLWMEAKQRGFNVVPDTEKADAYVINSCTVTHGADRDTRSFARRLKRQNPNSIVAVVGCYGQVGKQELLRMGEVDYVLGTADKHRIFDLIEEDFPETKKDQVSQTTGFLPETFLGSMRARASIKVQDGCNFRCSFCIIPQARGRSRSLEPDVVKKQIRTAWEMGFSEVVLTGIHLAHYGWDKNSDLLSLIRELLKEKEGPRIRLSTLDPFEIPDTLIDMLQSEERLCPYFHIALQSGSDSILAKMRRIYQAHEFVEVTQKIGKANPNTFIGADVIVGFPGESDEDFEQTIRCLKASYWTKLHVFPFSVRKNTAAENMNPQIPKEIIDARSLQLRKLSERQYEGFVDSQIGKTKGVLLEKQSPTNPSLWYGHTENFLPTITEVTNGKSRSIHRATLTERQNEKVWTTPVIS